MIIIGKSRAGPQKLGKYLDSQGKNERVQLIEIRGTIADDIPGAIQEMAAFGEGTRCEKPLYHAMINPEPPHLLTPEQRSEAIEALEVRLGFVGHSRVVVLHEKLGRQHIHVVWSRIDLERMATVSDSHNYRKHEEVARDLERRFGHDRVQGAHHERDGVKRPDRTPSRAELQQQERTGVKGKDVKAEVTAAFRASDGPEAFRAALEEKGYILARGDRRDHVIIDRLGGVHSLARRIEGMKAAELREFMAPIDKASLPSIEEAREIAADRMRRAREWLAAHGEALNEKAYARGDDYVTQTRAALRDHQQRQKRLDKEGRRTGRPAASTKEDRADRKRDEILADHDRRRRQAREEVKGRGNSPAKEQQGHGANVEMTEARRARIDRLRNAVDEHDRTAEREDRGPDRQREAPGGGRTRSR